MKISIMQNKKVRLILISAVWLILWQILYMLIDQEILFVSPFGVIKKLWELCVLPAFWKTVLTSLFRIMTGYFLALVIGAALACVTFTVPGLYEFFYPVISMVQATPIASFIILALVWIKTGNVPLFISFLMVLPLIWSNLYEGLKNTDKKLLEMAQIYGFGQWKKIKLIYIPSIMPYFTAAAATSIGLAWKSGIAAEVICTPKFSIGGQIYNSKIYLETPELFAWTAVVIVLSVILEKLLKRIIRKAGAKYEC